MISRLILENFMAHGRTEIALGPGVTALTGPNNVGKSAVVEALRCLAQNPAPRHVIRHGAKEARVTLELADGARVVWIRKKASAGYQLWRPGAEAPEEFWKLGRSGVPEEIRRVLRLDLVDLESGEPVDVHLGNQREPVFLLNQPPSAAAAFFAASSESAHLLAMQNLLKRRLAEAKRDQGQTRARLAGLESRLDRLAGLPDLALALDAARVQEAALDACRERIPALESWLGKRADLAGRANRAAAQAQALAPLAPAPALAPTERLARAARGLLALDQARVSARDQAAALAPLAPPPDPAPTGRLGQILHLFRALQRNRAASQAQAQALAPLAQPPASQATAPLAAAIGNIIALKDKEKSLSARSASLARLQPSPSLRKTEALARLGRDLSACRAELAAAQKAGEACAASLHSLRARMADRLREIGACPTCGAALDLSRFIREGA